MLIFSCIFSFFSFLLNRCNFFLSVLNFLFGRNNFHLLPLNCHWAHYLQWDKQWHGIIKLTFCCKWEIFPPYSFWSDLWLNTFLFATWMVSLPLDAVCCFILDETVIPIALFSKLCLQERKCDLLYCWMMTNFCLHKSLLDGNKMWFLCLWELISIMKFHY